MKKSYHYSRWVEGIIVNTKKLVCSLGNVAEHFYEHLIFSRLTLLEKTGGRVLQMVIIILYLKILIRQKQHMIPDTLSFHSVYRV